MQAETLSARARAAGRCAVRIWRDESGLWGVLVAYPTAGGAATWCETHEEAIRTASALAAAYVAPQAGKAIA